MGRISLLGANVEIDGLQFLSIVGEIFEDDALLMAQEENEDSLYQRLHLDGHVVIIGQDDVVFLRDDQSAQLLLGEEILLEHPFAHATELEGSHLAIYCSHLLFYILREGFVCRQLWFVIVQADIGDRATEILGAVELRAYQLLHQWHQVGILLDIYRKNVNIVYAVLAAVILHDAGR